MVINITDVLPLFTWLLGPGWSEGRLFQPLALTIFLLIVCGGLIWAIVRLRRGYGSTGRGVGIGVSLATLLAIPLFAIVAVVLRLSAGKAESPFANIAALQWLLGNEWYQGALYVWLAVVVCAAAATMLFSWIFTALRCGPISALAITGRAAGDCVLDVVRISPRRVAALAWLAVKESIRRRIVVVFAVFVLLLLFAGWFLDPSSPDPAKLYLHFVLTSTSYLLILLVLFVSSMSLPADVKSRTLHTITTKPVRASEVVLGRIAGFSTVAFLLLLIMGVISYFFVGRGLTHSHEIVVGELKPLDGAVAGRPAGLQGRTTEVNQHRHNVEIDPDGNGRVQMEQGHWHDLQGDWKDVLAASDGEKRFRLGPPKGQLMARVPIRGEIAFMDTKGEPTDKGVNVGDEWTYRSYIQGGSLASAIWTFRGVTEDKFPDGLPVELELGVFRTHKGEMAKGVPGSLLIRNPKAGADVKPTEVRIFESKEFQIDTQVIPREFLSPDGTKVDLFKDFVSDGEIEVWLRCAAPGQYFGVAQGDMYLRAKNASFTWNFAKGYIGVWLLSVMVISFGVLFSTFLSAPIAVLATIGAMAGGLFHDFMYKLATHQTYGGGPFESLVRILTQQNMTSEMEPGLLTTLVQTLDQPAEVGLWLMASVLPDIDRYKVFANHVASGFNLSGDTMWIYAFHTFAFVVPLFVAAYLCLKHREIAKQ